MPIDIRPVRLPEDAPGIAALDASFETSSVFHVDSGPRGFRLIETPIPTRTKRFWVYDLDRPDREWDEAHVATDGDRIVGFVATSWQFWNRRLVLWHVYVDRPHRGTGLGHRLLGKVYERAERQKALLIHLETSNYNAPGIAWYERQGFTLGGLDTTLYSGTPAAEECGLYFTKRL